jgi:hypothetical protein
MAFFFAMLSQGQIRAIKGRVVDFASSLPVSNASVSILKAKDSILYIQLRTNTEGAFFAKDLARGNYILLLSFQGYADYIDRFSINNDTTVDFKDISITPKIKLLSEVVIKGRKIAAVTVKGDTTEFLADSFKVRPNDRVEDLLKRLPNIQVDRHGVITAEGEVVNKVLLDGEEFFGDDPTLITKNIRADMVSKVQLFDQSSKQATFTGIPDGKKTKTINIQLKDDRKNGYFGKIKVGAGIPGIYENQAMINIFDKKQKFAAYGVASNNAVIGLNGTDQASFNSINIGGNNGLDSWDGNYEGQGLPVAQTGGTHYDTKWGGDKYHINGNYKIGNLDIEGDNHSISQNILPQSILNSNSHEHFQKHNLSNKVDLSLDIKKNESSSINISVSGGIHHINSENSYSQDTRNQNDSLVNSTSRSLSSVIDRKDLNTIVLWTKRFSKKGRTFSINFGQSVLSDNSHGFLISNSTLYDVQAHKDSTLVVNQFKNNKNDLFNFSIKPVYTEPLSEKSYLATSYYFFIQNNESDLSSYNQDRHIYDVLDSLHSSRYTLKQTTQRLGEAFNYSGKKLFFTVSADVGITDFSQHNKTLDDILDKKFVDWYPQAIIRYSIKPQKRLSLSYSGQTKHPELSQIQPVITNDDPLNVFVGNTNLGASYQSDVNLIYRDFSPLSNRTILLNSTLTFTNNPIVTNVETNAEGKNTISFKNSIDFGTRSINTYLLYGKMLKGINVYLSNNAGVKSTKYVNYINGDLNINQANTYSAGSTLSKTKQDKYDISLSISGSYNTNVSSLQSAFQVKYWAYNLSPEISFYLPANFTLSSVLNYKYQQKTIAFNQDFRQAIWNFYIDKSFFKNRNFSLRITANDILDQNRGFNRVSYNNLNLQNNYLTISRNFLLSAVWDINKMARKQ